MRQSSLYRQVEGTHRVLVHCAGQRQLHLPRSKKEHNCYLQARYRANSLIETIFYVFAAVLCTRLRKASCDEPCTLHRDFKKYTLKNSMLVATELHSVHHKQKWRRRVPTHYNKLNSNAGGATLVRITAAMLTNHVRSFD
jgi:hypothetical protein